MSAQTAEESALAQLLVQALNLDGVEASSLAPDAALFGQSPGSPGPDSHSPLESALPIRQKFGLELKSHDEAAKKSLASLRALSGLGQPKLSAE